jgi:hypothetical protein
MNCVSIERHILGNFIGGPFKPVRLACFVVDFIKKVELDHDACEIFNRVDALLSRGS